MIFYFSGTGNSKWVAEQVAKHLKDRIVNIADASADKTYTFEKGEKVGIVFPVYAWRAPDVVTEFVQTLNVGDAYTYAICTYGEEGAFTLKKLSRCIPLDSGFGIEMPSNYVMWDMDSKEQIKEKIEKAKKQIEDICALVGTSEKTFDCKRGKRAFLKSNLLWWSFNRFARMTKPFTVNKDICTGCGLCQTICPSNTISLQDGRPAWIKGKCYQCLGCINRCPVCAIEYGKGTKGKPRYYFGK